MSTNDGQMSNIGTSSIWVEKYRPTTTKDVILSQSVERMLSKVLDSKELPNLIFEGNAGVGKCLDYNEEIEIFVDDETKKMYNL